MSGYQKLPTRKLRNTTYSLESATPIAVRLSTIALGCGCEDVPSRIESGELAVDAGTLLDKYVDVSVTASDCRTDDSCRAVLARLPLDCDRVLAYRIELLCAKRTGKLFVALYNFVASASSYAHCDVSGAVLPDDLMSAVMGKVVQTGSPDYMDGVANRLGITAWAPSLCDGSLSIAKDEEGGTNRQVRFLNAISTFIDIDADVARSLLASWDCSTRLFDAIDRRPARITVEVDAETRKRLAGEAAMRGSSLTSYVSELLREFALR